MFVTKKKLNKILLEINAERNALFVTKKRFDEIIGNIDRNSEEKYNLLLKKIGRLERRQ